MSRSTRPNFKFEDACEGLVCGIDEVGRGPLAGPVVACAVIIDRVRMPKKILDEVNDSKKLKREKREYLFRYLQEYSHSSVAECSVEEIDTINILQASLLAMKKACEALPHMPAVALVDGNKVPKLSCRVQTIVSGDAKSLSIAAASIIAKHYRDELMRKLAEEFPHYGWENNAGYGTAQHLKAIEIHGITRLHRRSFSTVSKNSDKERFVND
jgi:ribonuclease HII